MSEEIKKEHEGCCGGHHHDSVAHECECGHNHDEPHACCGEHDSDGCDHDHEHGDGCGCGHDHGDEVNYIQLSFEEGKTSECAVLGVFPYLDHDYIALFREDTETLMVLEYIENDERITMKIIQSPELLAEVEAEYNRITE